MTSPLPTLFGWHPTKQLDLDQPDGCDHDQNVYHYRLVDGAMVLRGIALGPRWESRPMDWQGLSCYKQRGDMQMALITKESGRPEPRADKDEIMAKAIPLINGGMKVAIAARELGVPVGTLHNWVNKARKKQAELAKHEALLESVDAGKPVRSMGCVEPELKPELQSKATEVAVEDNDWQDDEDDPIPYTITSPLDLAIESSFARARIKVDKLTKDPIALALIKDLIQAGVL
jgi:transposase-like protein